MPIIESLKIRRCENTLSWCQKLEAEKLQRFGSRLCLSFLIKGVALSTLNLAQEPEESWTPINISHKGQSIQVLPEPQGLWPQKGLRLLWCSNAHLEVRPCSHGPSGDSQSPGKLCCFHSWLPLPTIVPSLAKHVRSFIGALSGLTSGGVVQFLPSYLSLFYYTFNN